MIPTLHSRHTPSTAREVGSFLKSGLSRAKLGGNGGVGDRAEAGLGVLAGAEPRHRARPRRRRRPPGDGPGACPGLRVVDDPRKPPPQLNSSRQLPFLIEDGADHGSTGLGDEEHLKDMVTRPTAGKRGTCPTIWEEGHRHIYRMTPPATITKPCFGCLRAWTIRNRSIWPNFDRRWFAPGEEVRWPRTSAP